MSEIERIASICNDCAEQVYDKRAPTPTYAGRVARLLFMTAGHESLFKYRRQHGFKRDSLRGAFGLWQTEYSSMLDSYRWLQVRPAALHHACEFLRGQDADGQLDLPFREHLRMVQTPLGDALSCLYGRLHYFRVPEPVPERPYDQATYAKKYFNTELGKATAAGYQWAFQHWWRDEYAR